MVEHLTGNIWNLEEGEYVGESPEKGFTGPGLVRVHEHTDINKLGIQFGDKWLEIEGLDFEAAVKKITPNP